jgi:thiol-disulfide isomerase/thioredoxin
MNFRLFALLLTASAFALGSCDVIEGPKKDYDNVIGTSDKKVLIEDFTGHYCGNCPGSHEVAHELDSIYGDNLVILAVHSGNFFGTLHPPTYITDWRTQMGIDLDIFYNAEAQGYPKGMVNRKVFGSSALTNFTNWNSLVNQVFAEAPELSIDLSSVYDSVTNSAQINVDMEYFTEGNPNLNLVVVVKEDSIVAPQKNYDATPEDVLDYLHMDMLRGTVTSGTWGDVITGAVIPVGTLINRSYTLTLDPAWVPAHCEIIAYVMDNSTKEILQVEEAKLIAP